MNRTSLLGVLFRRNSLFHVKELSTVRMTQNFALRVCFSLLPHRKTYPHLITCMVRSVRVWSWRIFIFNHVAHFNTHFVVRSIPTLSISLNIITRTLELQHSNTGTCICANVSFASDTIKQQKLISVLLQRIQCWN